MVESRSGRIQKWSNPKVVESKGGRTQRWSNPKVVEPEGGRTQRWSNPMRRAASRARKSHMFSICVLFVFLNLFIIRRSVKHNFISFVLYGCQFFYVFIDLKIRLFYMNKLFFLNKKVQYLNMY